MTPNKGVIHEAIPHNIGYVGGVGSELPDINLKGDWEPHLPEFEKQNQMGLETMNCVQFSRASNCETWANFYGRKLNISDRAWYWLTGCTERGNTFSACDYNIKIGGGIAEERWPWDKPMTREEYGKKPPDDIVAEMKNLLTEWNFGMLVWVPTTIEGMKAALKKGPLWACNETHAFNIIRVDDRIRIFDTYPDEGNGRGSYPLSYAPQLVAAYIAPFTPKLLAPQPMINLPKDCLVVLVDGRGDRLMNVDGTKLYQDEAGKLDLELMARNAKKNAEGILMTHGYPVVHLKTADVAHLPRVNLKGQPVPLT